MAADGLLLGRVTYEGFAAAWPSRTDEFGFADKFNTMPKYVVSSTLSDPEWNNSHVVALDEIPGLEGELLVNGSGQLVQALLERGLVDELRLMVFPTVLGSGRRLFGETAVGAPVPARLHEAGRRRRRDDPRLPACNRRRAGRVASVNADVSTPEEQPLLARLAHVIVRRRRIVIGVWIVLTLFGAFSAGQVSKRWFESFSIPGYSAYEANQRTLQDLRHRRAGAARRRLPQRRRRHEGSRASQKAIDAAAAVNPGSRVVVVLLDRQPRLRLEGRAHDVRRDLPAGHARPSARRCTSSQVRAKLKAATPAGRAGVPDRPRPALRRVVRRSSGGPSVLTEALIGGLGCARDPVLRLRDAARGADADRDRDRVDPEHVHARLDPDLHHRTSRSSSSS